MVRKVVSVEDKNRLMGIEGREKGSLSFEELGRLLKVCETLKDRALLELAVESGIRREDLVGIELMNVNLEGRTVLFWEEKKDYPHTVVLSPDLVNTLRMYINSLPKGERFLFPAEKGIGHLSGRHAYNVLQRNLVRAGIRKHLEFHALRRTFVRLSKSMGRDMKFVMQQTNDTARTLVEEYEGYTLDDMRSMLERDSILKRVNGGVVSSDDCLREKFDEFIVFLQDLRDRV